jgi:hypothetical protein
MKMSTSNPKNMTTKLQGIERGIDQVLVNNVTMMFRGQNSGAKTLAPLNAGYLADYTNVDSTKTAYQAAIAARKLVQAATEAYVKDVQAGLIATFGEDSEEYKLFGFTPRKKPAPLTPAKKQQKYQNLVATRAARHTMGKRQKQNVKGAATPPSTSGPPTSGNVSPPKSS